MKTLKKQQAIMACLNEIYPDQCCYPVVSSASRALIDTVQQPDRGLGSGKHLALAVTMAVAINLVAPEAKAVACTDNPINLYNASLTGCTVGTGGSTDAMNISAGGIADSTTIKGSGRQDISSGGLATNTMLSGRQFVSSGGIAASSTLISGRQTVFANALATDTQVHGGGLQIIYGVATDTTVTSGGKQFVSAGGSATSTTLDEGDQYVYGLATDTTINGGGQLVYSLASNTTVNSTGRQILSGGTTVDTIVNAGGIQYVMAGSATNATLNAGGSQYVNDGGTATNTIVSSGGTQSIYWSGAATDTIINSGGTQEVLSGGRSTGIDQKVGGNVLADVYGNDTDTYISGTNESGGFSLSNGVADHFILYSGGLQNVFNNGLATHTTIDADGWQEIWSGGSATNTTINSGGWQYIGSGGTVNSTTINSGLQTIRDGTAINTIINGGWQEIWNGGSATGTTINAGGWQYIWEGGSATDTTVNSDGWQYIGSGGTVNSTTINSGRQSIYNGTVINTTINGGEQYIWEGGLATDTTINASGVQNINYGGSATNTTINTGGLQNISSGGIATDTTVNGSGTLAATSGSIIDGTLTLADQSRLSGYVEITGTTTLVAQAANDRVILEGNGTQLVYNKASNDTLNINFNGDGGLIKTGTGTLTLTGINTYTGGTIVAGGALSGNTNSLQGHINTASATNVTFDQNFNGAYTGNMSGSGSLTKTGTGTLTLTGINTYTGGTSLDNGTLILDGSLGSGTLVGNLTGQTGTTFGLTSSARYTGDIINPIHLWLDGANTQWTNTGNSTLASLSLQDNAIIAFAHEGDFKTLTVTGDFSGNGRFDLNTDVGAQRSDQISFQNNTDGHHILSAHNYGGEPASPGEFFRIIEVTGTGANNANFALKGEYVDAGAYRYELKNGSKIDTATPGDWYLYNTGKESQIVQNLEVIGSYTDYTMIGVTENLNRRLGELRLDIEHLGGIWSKAHYRNFRNTLYEEASGTQKVSGIDIGADKLISQSNGRLYVGGLFGYGASDFTTNHDATFDTTYYQLGAYATWLHDGGTYIDVNANYFWFDRDYRFSQANTDFEYASDNTSAYLVSIEAGHRIDLAQGWFIEPQTKLLMTRSNSFDLTTDHGTRIGYHTGKGTFLNAGAMFGKTIKDQASTMQVYSRFERLQPLRTRYNISVNDTHFSSKKPDGSWMVAAGAQVQHKHMQFHLEADANIGSSDIKQRWGINAGVRWMF